MEDKKVYALSLKLKEIRTSAVMLTHRDLYGYHHMVNSSEKGFDCTYAKVLKRNAFAEKELNQLKTELENIKEMILTVEGLLNEEERRTSSQ